MFDLGDDLLIGSHRIPWLIWIQLLVMLLLIILLYYFSIYALGLDLSLTAAAAASHSGGLDSVTSRHGPPRNTVVVAAASTSSSRLHRAKVGEIHSLNDEGISTSRRRVGKEEIQEREGSSSAKDATNAPVLDRYYHPCHYLGLAKQAFLKCLGLDPPYNDRSSKTRHRKEN